MIAPRLVVAAAATACCHCCPVPQKMLVLLVSLVVEASVSSGFFAPTTRQRPTPISGQPTIQLEQTYPKRQRCCSHSSSLSMVTGDSDNDDQSDNGDGDNESLESLAAKIERALMKETDQRQAKWRVLNSRLKNLSLNRTTVAKSSIAGRGLFASQNCPKGSVLTCFPGDGIIDFDNEEDYDGDEIIYWGDHVNTASMLLPAGDDGNIIRNNDYLMYVTEEVGVVGFAQLDNDPVYLGHFCNDGASVIPQSTEDVALYLEESVTRANAEEQSILDSHVAIVATRDIQKDEEIFLCYGVEYWMQQQQQHLQRLL